MPGLRGTRRPGAPCRPWGRGADGFRPGCRHSTVMPRHCRCCRCHLARPPAPDRLAPENAIGDHRQHHGSATDAGDGRRVVGGVVTNPINKAALYRAGFRHPGHTEFLAELTGVPGHEVMMLACPGAARGAGDGAPLAAGCDRGAVDRGDHRRRPHPRRRASAMISASRRPASPSPGSTRTPARMARSAARTPGLSRPAIAALRLPTGSTPAGRGRPTQCSARPPDHAMMRPSACTTTRR